MVYDRCSVLLKSVQTYSKSASATDTLHFIRNNRIDMINALEKWNKKIKS